MLRINTQESVTHRVLGKPIWSLRVTCRGEPLRVVGVEWEDSGIEYRKDGKGKDNVGCVHSLLQKINNKMQAQVSANSLSGPPQIIFLTQSYTALLLSPYTK